MFRALHLSWSCCRWCPADSTEHRNTVRGKHYRDLSCLDYKDKLFSSNRVNLLCEFPRLSELPQTTQMKSEPSRWRAFFTFLLPRTSVPISEFLPTPISLTRLSLIISRRSQSLSFVNSSNVENNILLLFFLITSFKLYTLYIIYFLISYISIYIISYMLLLVSHCVPSTFTCS